MMPLPAPRRAPKRVFLLGNCATQSVPMEVAQRLGYAVTLVDAAPQAFEGLSSCDILALEPTQREPLRKTLEQDSNGTAFAHSPGLQGVQDWLNHGTESAPSEVALSLAQFRRFAAAGLGVVPQLGVHANQGFDAWLEAALGLGFPLVLKSIDAQRSWSASHAEALGQLHASFAGSQQEFLLQAHEGVESFLCETYFSNARPLWQSIALRRNRCNPGGQIEEQELSLDEGLPEHLRFALESLASHCAGPMGHRDGLLVGEFQARAGHDPRILSMRVQNSAGHLTEWLTPLHCGVQTLAPSLQRVMGDKIQWSALKPRWRRPVCLQQLLLPPGKTAQRRPWVQHYRTLENVAKIEFTPAFLNPSPGEAEAERRIGYVVCVGEQLAEARKLSEHLCSEIIAQLI